MLILNFISEVIFLKNYEKYMKWIVAFVFGAALIAVYKTFDNIQNVLSFFGDILSASMPFVIGFFIAYICYFSISVGFNDKT